MPARASLPKVARRSATASTAYSWSTASSGNPCSVGALLRPRRAMGHAAQLRRPFGEIVDVILHRLVDLVEKLVESDEVGPLTFQWACLSCVWRSIASASRASRRSTSSSARRARCRSRVERSRRICGLCLGGHSCLLRAGWEPSARMWRPSRTSCHREDGIDTSAVPMTRRSCYGHVISRNADVISCRAPALEGHNLGGQVDCPKRRFLDALAHSSL